MTAPWTLEAIEKLLTESEHKRGANDVEIWKRTGAVDTLNRHHRDIIRQLVQRVKELEKRLGMTERELDRSRRR